LNIRFILKMAANTLTGLIPVIYEAATMVFRELTGLIPAVSKDATAAGAAVNQTVRSPIVPAITPQPIVYGSYPVDEGEQTVAYTDMTLDKAYQAPVKWNGEEEVSLGAMKDAIVKYQFQEAFRAIANLVEADLAALYKGASRAYGTAGTTPFASSHADVTAQLKKILDDNGVPISDRSLVIDTTAGANLRSLTGLNTVYAAGTEATLRQGLLLPLNGFDVRESAAIKAHTKGTQTGIDVNFGAGYAIGDRTIVSHGSDSGTLLAGDVVTWVGDANKYVCTTSTISGAASGNVVINKPGLMSALADTTEMTTGGSYRANMAFHKNAIHLATRTPFMPSMGDAASDITVITDPLTGLSFQVAMYKLHRMVKFEIGLVWGATVMNPQALCLLLG
jgi:hypothetical protein